jgi:hypothetical protein
VALIVIAIIVSIVAIWGGVRGIASTTDSMQRIVVPGTHTITFDEAGEYRIFHERRSSIDGRTYSTPSTPAMEIAFRAADGTGIPLRPVSGETYSFGSREGQSVFAFPLDQPGRYTLDVQLPQGGGPTVLAIGRGVMGMVGGIFGIACGVFGAVILALLGIALLIIGLIRRGRPAPPVI